MRPDKTEREREGKRDGREGWREEKKNGGNEGRRGLY